MIEPVRFGSALRAAMSELRPSRGQVALWPLGQAGFALKFPAATVYIDLYLSNHCEAVLPRPFDHRRLTRAPLDPAEIADADVIVCTHDHLDHLDVPTMRTLSSTSPRSVAVTPASAAATLRRLDWPEERLVGTRTRDEVRLGEITLSAFAVRHENYDEDPSLGHPYQGYCISDGNVSVCHVGDALADDDLVAWLRELSPDVVLLPINGRDAARRALGFAGNMNAEEAAGLAASARVAQVVPMHADMFAQNVDAGAREQFLAACAARSSLRAQAPPVGDVAVVKRL